MSAASFFAGRQVLVLSSVDWGAAWQRHQAFASAFEAAGAEVFFVENTGFRSPGARDLSRVVRRVKGLLAPRPRASGGRVVSPLALPPTAKPFRALNASVFVPRLLRKLSKLGLRPGPVVFAYLPTATTLSVLDRLEPELLVYDCVDNFAGHPTPPRDLAATEGELLRRADLVLTTSQYLFEAKRAVNPHTLLLHHGADEAFFIPPGPPPGPRPRLCYFGTVWSAVDFEALRALGEAGFEVDLIGPVKEPPPALPASVRFLPAVAHEKLPEVLAPYGALLLPYADTPYNLGVAPAKLYECLATGRPVLASNLRSLRPLAEHLYLAAASADFPAIASKLRETETPERVRARVALAREHSTPSQIRALETALAAALPRRALRGG